MSRQITSSLQEYADLLHEFMNAVKQNYGEEVLIQVRIFSKLGHEEVSKIL